MKFKMFLVSTSRRSILCQSFSKVGNSLFFTSSEIVCLFGVKISLKTVLSLKMSKPIDCVAVLFYFAVCK